MKLESKFSKFITNKSLCWWSLDYVDCIPCSMKCFSVKNDCEDMFYTVYNWKTIFKLISA